MNSRDMDNQKQFQEKFESLPLDEKISVLFRMEVSTISEAVNYVMKEPMKVLGRLGDFLTDLGTKVEREMKYGSEKGKTESEKTTQGGTHKKKTKRESEPGNSPA